MKPEDYREMEFRQKSYLRGYNKGFDEGYKIAIELTEKIPRWIPARRHLTLPSKVLVNTGWSIAYRDQVERGEFYIPVNDLLERIPKIGGSYETTDKQI